MSRRRILITSAVAVVAFLSGGWFMQQGSRPSESVYQRARLFDDILSHVSDLYVDSIDQRQLYRMAIDGMLGELRDPYSGYLDGRDLRNLNELSTGNYAGGTGGRAVGRPDRRGLREDHGGDDAG
jgi:C-terminal processing protease CtpA/Prc